MPGPISAELFTRWLQFGAFSPVLRTHTSKNANAERRIWAYPHDNFLIMREAILLRYSLLPYIYTEARKTYESGVAFMRPMYYDYPEAGEAYAFTHQYMFGDDMMVAPITEAVSEFNQLAPQKIWIPEGDWVEWYSGKYFTGPAVVERHFTLEEIPLYVRAGSIIPMQLPVTKAGEGIPDPLVVTVFPARKGNTRVYEDEGNTNTYLEDAYAWTHISQFMPDHHTLNVRIDPAQGGYAGIPEARQYVIRVKGILPPQGIYLNGTEVPYDLHGKPGTLHWQYDGNQIAIVVHLPAQSVRHPLEVSLRLQSLDDLELLNGVQGKIWRLKKVMHLLNKYATKTKDWSPDFLVEAAQTGTRLSLRPETALEELRKLENIVPEVIREIYPVEGDSGIEKLAVLQLKTLLKADAGLFAPRKD
jgi:alpha-glucosidase